MKAVFDDKVQVWIERTADHADLSAFEALLDDSERARAARFVHAHDRSNFIVAHGMKRKYLAEALETRDPKALDFAVYSHGKPYLKNANLHFNLSHSHGFSALAVSRYPCGIDIEAHRTISQLPLLIEKTMTASERQQISRATSPLKAFIDRWVVKEAFLKLSGVGLGVPLASLCTESEIRRLHGSLSLLRNAALFFRRGHDYSIAVSSARTSDFELKNSYGGLPLIQGFA